MYFFFAILGTNSNVPKTFAQYC